MEHTYVFSIKGYLGKMEGDEYAVIESFEETVKSYLTIERAEEELVAELKRRGYDKVEIISRWEMASSFFDDMKNY